jgi:hypothetical protein
MAKRGPSRFRERELARAVRAARDAGGVERVEVAVDGTINVILAKAGETAAVADDWTDEIAKLKAKAPKARGR